MASSTSVGVMVAPLGFSVRLWASAQDAAEQSCRSGRAAREDRPGAPAERRAVGVGGCRDPEHVVHRAPQPHDSSRVGVLAPALALPRSWRRPAPRARRAPAGLLPFHSAAPGVEVRARDQDAALVRGCGQATRFKPSSPSPTDAVRDGSAKLGHPVQNVTREHGLTPLPR